MKQFGNKFKNLYLLFLLPIFWQCSSYRNNLHGFVKKENELPVYQNDSLQFKLTYFGNYTIKENNGLLKNNKIYSNLRKKIFKNDQLLCLGQAKYSRRIFMAIWFSPMVRNLNEFTKSTQKNIHANNSYFEVGDSLLKQNLKFNFLTDSLSLLSSHKYNTFSYRKKNDFITEYHIAYAGGILSLVWILVNEKEYGKEEILINKYSDNAPIMSTLDTLSNAKSVLNDPSTIASNAYDENNYLKAITELKKIKRTFNTHAQSSIYWQEISTYASFIENEDSLSFYADKASGGKYPLDSSKYNKLKIKIGNYKQFDAIEVIKQKSLEHQVVMMNENHYFPETRKFLKELLPKLYDNGFRYLALEMLDYKDKDLATRGYPIQDTGFYTQEPSASELIREAFRLGFKVIAYEDTLQCDANLENSIKMNCISYRDQNMAKNLQNILNSDSQAKIFVYAGFDHIYKKTTYDWKHLAQFFKEITGISPFTIECTQMIKKSKNENEMPYYQVANDLFKIIKPSIFFDKDSCLINPEIKDMVDLQIFYPRKPYGNIDGLHNYNFSLPKSLKGNLILQVFYKKELEEVGIKKAIPLINLYVNQKFEQILQLRKDNYEVIVSDINGNIFYKVLLN